MTLFPDFWNNLVRRDLWATKHGMDVLNLVLLEADHASDRGAVLSRCILAWIVTSKFPRGV